MTNFSKVYLTGLDLSKLTINCPSSTLADSIFLVIGNLPANDIDIKYSDRGSVSIHIFLIKIFIFSRFHQNRHQNQHTQIEGVDFIRKYQYNGDIRSDGQ